MAGDLRHDVGGRTETVDADPFRVFRHPERGGRSSRRRGAGRRAHRRIFGQPEAEAVIGDGVFGIAAIDRAAGKRANRRGSRCPQAVAATPAGPAEPRHADALALGEAVDARAERGDLADDLMAGDDRIACLRQLAVVKTQRL